MSESDDHLKAGAVLLDEWKWRHQHCWRFISRWGLSALTVGLIPYVSVSKEGSMLLGLFGKSLLLFPIASLVLAQIAIWLFAAEYVRCRPVEAMYNKAMGKYSPNIVAKEATAKMPRGVAQLTILFIGVSSVVFYLVDLTILMRITGVTLAWWLWYFNGLIALILGGADWKLARSSAEEVSRRIEQQRLTS